ncbi:hypothetical protein C8R45DRAFT_1091556 [Mycena sanguinolenta]|nr:hypothetical protein C8R45DRAFT_1091556 [Mycena sanguinolenta]
MSIAASAAQTIYFQNLWHLFPVCFLIYDQIITLDKEVDLIWQHPKRPSTYWFFALRYGALLTNIPVLVFSFVTLPSHKSVNQCSQYNLVHQVFMLTTELAVSVVMIIRIYALYARSLRVLWGLIALGVCLMTVAVWSVLAGQNELPLTVLSGCHLSIVQSASIHLAIPWECLFVFDSIIFGLTVYNGYTTRRAVGEMNMPIHSLMVRDGAMYFAAMALANLANIVTFLIGGPLLPGSLATFATCMSVTLMTRLMLNINERSEHDVMMLNPQDQLQGGIDDNSNHRNIELPHSLQRDDQQLWGGFDLFQLAAHVVNTFFGAGHCASAIRPIKH